MHIRGKKGFVTHFCTSPLNHHLSASELNLHVIITNLLQDALKRLLLMSKVLSQHHFIFEVDLQITRYIKII